MSMPQSVDGSSGLPVKLSTEFYSSDNKHLSISELNRKAKVLRRDIVTMIAQAGSGHPGGSLSAVEIITALYYKIMRHDPLNSRWVDRDRFILSKGHAAPVLYSVLAECGYFPVEELATLRKLGSRLQGHTDMTSLPGIEMSGGSLGQGLSFGIGVSLAGRMDTRNYHTYVLMGDGECDEGQVWEAAMAASHFKLDNLTAVVDYNQQQIDGWNREIMNIEPIVDKWKAFNWHVLEINGHDMQQVINALENAKRIKGQPVIIIAHTIKGKGVSFMENNIEFHGTAPNAEQLKKALEELKD